MDWSEDDSHEARVAQGNRQRRRFGSKAADGCRCTHHFTCGPCLLATVPPTLKFLGPLTEEIDRSEDGHDAVQGRDGSDPAADRRDP